MHDEFESRNRADRHQDFSNAVAGFIAGLRASFERLNAIQFEAPWRRDDSIKPRRIDMNIAGLKLVIFTVAAAALALGTAVAATSPVLAHEPAPAAPVARIVYSDLNLGTAAGIARLNARVRAAAERLCATDGVEALDARLDILACRGRTIAAAAPAVRRAIDRFAAARGAGGNIALAN
jgi:UrcA family protein